MFFEKKVGNNSEGLVALADTTDPPDSTLVACDELNACQSTTKMRTDYRPRNQNDRNSPSHVHQVLNIMEFEDDGCPSNRICICSDRDSIFDTSRL